MKIVALSGGKDSSALALRLQEMEPGDYTYLVTPTGDELPPMLKHWQKLEKLLGKPLTYVRAEKTLSGYIQELDRLPGFRMRWCTKLLKIQPAMNFLRAQNGNEAEMLVGLRADEPERKGAGFPCKERFPLREWGWGLAEVRGYLASRQVQIPRRTDCARCWAQRLGEWHDLWEHYPDIYADAERQEAETEHTFRSATRDTWPASLAELRKRFEAGDKPPRRIGPDLPGQLMLPYEYVKCWICAR